ECAASSYLCLQGLAADELHAETHVVSVGLDAEHADNVGMADLRERTPFFQQLFFQEAVVDGPVQDLDRDFPIQVGIESAVYAAEAAGAHFLQQTKAPPVFT